jgi:hypothetical protein
VTGLLRASVVVLSWRDPGVLSRTLPSVLEAAGGGERHEVIVVDAGAGEDPWAVLAPFGEAATLVRAGSAGAAAAFNTALERCRGEVVVTLLADVLVDAGFLAPLLDRFRAPDVFAVACRCLDWQDDPVATRVGYRFDPHGLFRAVPPDPPGGGGAAPARSATWYAPWAHAAWRRDALRQLGGFEERFGGASGCWADADACYRAWKRGLRVLWEPESVVRRLGVEDGWGSCPADDRLGSLEGLLFLAWANLTDRDALERHLAALPDLVGIAAPWVPRYVGAARLLLADWVDGQAAAALVSALPPVSVGPDGWPRAFAGLVARLPWVIQRRLADRPHLRRTDAEVFQAVNGVPPPR